MIILHASLIVPGNKLDGSSKACIARRDFFAGKNRTFFKTVDVLPSKLPRLVEQQWKLVTICDSTLTALCSFAITSTKIVCCNFCKGLFLKAGWRWVDRNYGNGANGMRDMAGEAAR